MSTRATYHIKPAYQHDLAATFYIHHDGYPAGAAHYFAQMLNLDNERGGWPCMFLRANDGAELTDSHKAHGDTEYRYDLDGKALTVTMYERVWNGSGDGFERAKFPKGETLDIVDFITKHSDNSWSNAPRNFAKLHGRYVAAPKARAWIENRLGYAQAAYFQGWTGNACGALDEVMRHDHLLTPNERNICASLGAALAQKIADKVAA